MSTLDSSTTPFSQRQRANTRRLGAWTAAWTITLALAVFGGQWLWPESSVAKLVATALHLVVGLRMIYVHRQQLLGLDELQQRLQLEAMAITLGLTLVVGLAYSALDVTDAVGFDAEISHLVLFMGVSYLAATAVGQRRVA